jgi:hypothetical protein
MAGFQTSTEDVPTRELLTFSMLVALGGCEAQVKGHVAANLNVGSDPRGRPPPSLRLARSGIDTGPAREGNAHGADEYWGYTTRLQTLSSAVA